MKNLMQSKEVEHKSRSGFVGLWKWPMTMAVIGSPVYGYLTGELARDYAKSGAVSTVSQSIGIGFAAVVGTGLLIAPVHFLLKRFGKNTRWLGFVWAGLTLFFISVGYGHWASS